MLNINHESLFKELKTIESQLDMVYIYNIYVLKLI